LYDLKGKKNVRETNEGKKKAAKTCLSFARAIMTSVRQGKIATDLFTPKIYKTVSCVCCGKVTKKTAKHKNKFLFLFLA
jgi:hypothetical protein